MDLLKQGLTILIPAYKEGENLKYLLPDLQNKLKNTEHEILVIGLENEEDDTISICSENNCKYFPRKNGVMYGNAIRTGILHSEYEYTVIMDADGSHNTTDIIKMYDEIETSQYDLIIGSRYCNGGNSHNPIILKIMSYTLNLTYRFVFSLNVKDISNSFRLYKTSQLKQLNLKCDNFDIVEEILLKLIYSIPDFKVKEIPVYFSKRLYGKSKRDLFIFIFSYIITIFKLYKLKKEMRKRK